MSDMATGTYSFDLEASSVASKPHLFEHEFTFDTAYTGQSLGFKLKATNDMGSTTSESYLIVLIASTPSTPTDLILSVSTNSTYIEV